MVGDGWMDGIFFRKLVGCFGVYSAYPQMVENMKSIIKKLDVLIIGLLVFLYVYKRLVEVFLFCFIHHKKIYHRRVSFVFVQVFTCYSSPEIVSINNEKGIIGLQITSIYINA